MSSDDLADNGFDAWLTTQYARLVEDLSTTLDLATGAAEAVQLNHMASLATDLNAVLDLEGGLAAIVGPASGHRQVDVTESHDEVQVEDESTIDTNGDAVDEGHAIRITQGQLETLIGSAAYDRSGDKIGKVGQVYLDDRTNEPTWVTVHTGLFGTNETFVPVRAARFSDDGVTLAYDKAQVKDALNISVEGHLSPQEEERLYRYYGIDYGDTSALTTDDAMTRSEEQLRVGTARREAGRTRLRKHVVTEHQQGSMPVSNEEIRVEREPVTAANRGDADDGPDVSEDEHEKRLVGETEAVPVERIRLGTETVELTESVSGEGRPLEVDYDLNRRER